MFDINIFKIKIKIQKQLELFFSLQRNNLTDSVINGHNEGLKSAKKLYIHCLRINK